MKTERTIKLETMLERKFNRDSQFYAFECTLGWNGYEIVDCVMYDCDRCISCYEIKQSVADFHSKNKLSFFGNKNYFVMPADLYRKVKDEIPREIGCYVAMSGWNEQEEISINQYGIQFKKTWTEPADGWKELRCLKYPEYKRELGADRETIMASMLRSIQRDRGYTHHWEDLKGLED